MIPGNTAFLHVLKNVQALTKICQKFSRNLDSVNMSTYQVSDKSEKVFIHTSLLQATVQTNGLKGKHQWMWTQTVGCQSGAYPMILKLRSISEKE